MGRYIGPVCRLCRREGRKLFLKGEKCFTAKCPFERRPYPPGQHGRMARLRRGRESDYARQLRAKQQAKRIYGVGERQFRRYFDMAVQRRGLTGLVLLQLLESRLDNVVYRLGFADSRAQARQLVRHGHFDVNGRKTDIPSYLVSPGDVVSVRTSSRSKTYFKERTQVMQGNVSAPAWLSLNLAEMSGSVVGEPSREDVEIPLNEQLIVEYYSR